MVRGISHRIKKYVEVIAEHDFDGNIVPLTVVWEDGRRFDIDEILDVRQAAARKVGGNGMRYLVRIRDTETFIFHEKPAWFVEEKVREPYSDYSYGNFDKR